MNIKNYLIKIQNEIKDYSETPILDAEIILSFAINKNREFLFMYPNYLISKEEIKIIENLKNKRINGYPIAYIIKKKNFFNIDFFVNKHVLVPRPETEILVERVCEKIKHTNTLLDIGTGSGCIPISIGKNKKLKKIIAIDICQQAINIAKINSKNNKIKMNFIESDLLSDISEDITKEGNLFITANLPYVPIEEKHSSVKKEPQKAIFSNNNGMEHYLRLFQQLKNINFEYFIFEFHPPQKNIFEMELQKIFPKKNITPIKDYSSQFRFIEIY